MIILYVILWIICASVTAGMILYNDPWEWEDATWLLMMECMVGWWLFAFAGIMYLIFKQLSKLPMFVAGILTGMHEKRESRNEKSIDNLR